MSVDWNKEAEALGTSDFLKFTESGRFSVKFLSDGEPDQYEDPKTGKITPQHVFDVEFDGKELKRSMGKGRTTGSEWGQLVLLGRYHGSLTGKTFTYIVKYNAAEKKGDYTIEEALPLIKKHEDEQGTSKIEQPKPATPPADPKDQPKEESPKGGSAINKAFEKTFKDDSGNEVTERVIE
jgi:hypothetical protein